MGLFDHIGKTVTNTGRTTIQRGKELADITRLNTRIAENQNRIKILYGEIGEIYYQLHANDAEPEMSAQVNSITKMKQQNQQWEEEIQGLRGFQKCPHCGQMIRKNMVYCDKCGSRILAENLIVCKKCGAILKKDTMFCTYCGERVPSEIATGQIPVISKTCPVCGLALPDEVMFCPRCGTRVQEQGGMQGESQPEMEGPDPSGEELFDSEEHKTSVCPICNAELEDDEMFCTNCGAKVR